MFTDFGKGHVYTKDIALFFSQWLVIYEVSLVSQSISVNSVKHKNQAPIFYIKNIQNKILIFFWSFIFSIVLDLLKRTKYWNTSDDKTTTMMLYVVCESLSTVKKWFFYAKCNHTAFLAPTLEMYILKKKIKFNRFIIRHEFPFQNLITKNLKSFSVFIFMALSVERKVNKLPVGVFCLCIMTRFTVQQGVSFLTSQKLVNRKIDETLLCVFSFSFTYKLYLCGDSFRVVRSDQWSGLVID